RWPSCAGSTRVGRYRSKRTPARPEVSWLGRSRAKLRRPYRVSYRHMCPLTECHSATLFPFYKMLSISNSLINNGLPADVQHGISAAFNSRAPRCGHHKESEYEEGS